jgi:hypothetical protein
MDRCASIDLEHPLKEAEKKSHTRVDDDRTNAPGQASGYRVTQNC